MPWEYKRTEQQFEQVPAGKHRIRVCNVEKTFSRAGNDMIVIQFEVSGYTGRLFHYITFLDDKPEVTNRMLTQFFDSFKDIEEGDFNLNSWIGKTGACVVKEDPDFGPKISYFIKAEKQGDLPAWQNPDGSKPQLSVTDLDLPF